MTVETLTNDRAEQNLERGLEEVPVEQDKAQDKHAKTRTEVGSNSQKQQNWTV
jgi:hypothetical protein